MDIYKELSRPKKNKQDLNLGGAEDVIEPEFKLQSDSPNEFNEAKAILQLPSANIEQAEFQPQLEFDGMAKPSFTITFEKCLSELEQLTFKNAQNLLESLEAQKVQLPYQCRDGYCGACRCKKITGEVSYVKEPMAWINDDEILPCVSIPTSDLHLKLSS